MTASVRLRVPGPGCTLQDGGRFGWLRYGVTPAGPMDWVAFETANRALGNAPDAAAIEIGPAGLSLVCDQPMSLAFAGGAFRWDRDGRTLPAAARLRLRPGEVLTARPGPLGVFAYCAVPGGFDLPPVLGSRATHTRSRLGGLGGRMLATGDELQAAADHDVDDAVIDSPLLHPDEGPIRIVPGPQADHFTEAAQGLLLAQSFTLTPVADRMAYRFVGPPLEHRGDFNIVSDGVGLGALQVAGDGQIMILMADRQPTGGYPKIAHVCRADIGRVAQLRPGQTCRFAAVTVETAQRALHALEDAIARTADDLAPLRQLPTMDVLQTSNLIGGVIDALDDPFGTV